MFAVQLCANPLKQQGSFKMRASSEVQPLPLLAFDTLWASLYRAEASAATL